MFESYFENLLTIRNLNSSNLIFSSCFSPKFALWLNLLRDYEFGFLIFFSDLAPVYCLLPNKPSFCLARCMTSMKLNIG